MKTDKDNKEYEKEESYIFASLLYIIAISLIAIGIGLKTEMSNIPIIIGVAMLLSSIACFIYTIKKHEIK